MRILLDTNVLLRSAEPGHPHHQVSADAIDVLTQRGHELAVVPQVFYELWTVATRPVENNGLGMPPLDVHRELALIQHLFRPYRDERGIFSFWQDLVLSLSVKGKQAHDARLAAAMQRHAISHLLTFNTADFTRYAFLTAITPAAVVTGQPIG